MPLLDNELARRHRHPDGREALELRPQPTRVRWEFDDLAAADGFDLHCAFVASVRPVDDPTERRMLQEVLLGGRPALTHDDVVTHFAPALRAAAAAAAKLKGAEAWLAPDARGPILDALKAAATKAAFACGLEVLPPFQLDVESPAYEQHSLRAMQRTLAEQQAAGQVEHFARAADLLKRFEDLRQAAPDLPAGRVLEQISPTDRGQMLQTLLLASAKQQGAADLWAVAGEYLVRVDARDPAAASAGARAKTALIPLPPTLGPLRSVQPARVEGERVLLVGARGGFMVVRPGTGGEPEVYADPAVESQLGFSRVVYLGKQYGYAGCHGEAGIVRWTPGHHSAPVATARPERFASNGRAPSPPPLPPDRSGASIVTSRAPGPRNLQAIDKSVLAFSVANRVWLMDLGSGDEATQLPPSADGEVIAIVPDAGGRHTLVVHEDGAVCTLDHATRELACVQRHGLRLRAAGALPWLGGTRLLLAPEEGPVQCVGADDPLVTQYASGHRGLRVVTGSADLVAGVSADRQRLLLWHTWDGRTPVAEVYLTGLTKHRVADVEFG